MLVIGSVAATAILGFLIGLRGGVAMAAAGFGVAVIIAVLDFVQIYPGGINGPSPAWPWGATSIVAYVGGLATRVIVSLRQS